MAMIFKCVNVMSYSLTVSNAANVPIAPRHTVESAALQ